MMSKSVGIKSPLFAVVLAVLIVCSERHVTVVNGQVPDDDPKAFLDAKERDVMAIAAKATTNHNGCRKSEFLHLFLSAYRDSFCR